jgi:hypothetical protein
MKKFLVILLMAIAGPMFSQTLQSPSEYLGYTLGTRYTPHHQVVAYCQYVANTFPTAVKMEQYGTTNEHRPLYLLTVSSPENLGNLTAIKANHIAAINGKSTTAATHAIVWLSYNVHGNEPSSSEAALQTLYELVNPANAVSKNWLKNTVVLIDPCLNPDGRDRYVNWFNSMVGANSNANPQTREHVEPWPGGRSNHYNFDLNRDWAWQTQVETQQRIKVYQTWMPHVHVDFHEQGFNEPYYFAPAAEPFHDVISPWQRNFQTQIGKNHAKYFDEKGWLYFTKERFDLFYPSYGDTYPTYNGSIGMTYEQGGHSRGGLAVQTEDGDTLTLVDRVAHHHTTGMSTVEMASANASNLVTEFSKFFEAARSGAKANGVKSYVVTSNYLTSLQPFMALLAKNGINFTLTNDNITGKGYEYFEAKETAIATQNYSVVIPTAQLQGTLLQVLMEPKSKLTDSATYDITAWSLPYVYGLKTFAVNTPVNAKAFVQTNMPQMGKNAYGYLLPYTNFASAKAMATLIKDGFKVRMAQKPITYKGKQYEAGSLLVLKNNNSAKWQTEIMPRYLQLLGTEEVVTLETGFMDKGPDFGSPDVVTLQKPKVTVLTGEGVSSLGAGEVWNFFDKVLEYPVNMVNASDFGRLNLKETNVLILPDGYYKWLGDKNTQAKLKDFVRGGGKIIALENAVAQMADEDFGLKRKEAPDAKKTDEQYLKKYADRERDALKEGISGAIYRVQLDNTHPLAFGYGSHYYTLKQDGNTYQFLKDGWNVGYLRKDNKVAGFVGSDLQPNLKDQLVLGVQEMGAGNIVYLADNPLFRLFWENGKLLFTNAVFTVGN